MAGAPRPAVFNEMLQIRRQQLEVFERQPRLEFERGLARYLQRYFPFEARHAALDAWVQLGLAKAGEHGFFQRYECSLYLALMAMLGAGFDEDPQLPWAAEALGASGERIDTLYARAIGFLQATGGRRCAWLVRAKLRLRKQDMHVLDQGVHARALAARLQERLVGLYPQKAAVLGEAAMKRLVQASIDTTTAQKVRSSAPAFIYAVHMLYLGSSFEADPCFPWTALARPDSEGGPALARYERMHARSLDHVERSFRFDS